MNVSNRSSQHGTLRVHDINSPSGKARTRGPSSRPQDETKRLGRSIIGSFAIWAGAFLPDNWNYHCVCVFAIVEENLGRRRIAYIIVIRATFSPVDDSGRI